MTQKGSLITFLAVHTACAVPQGLKRSPLKAGRDHVHHVLQNAGLNVRQSLHIIYLLTFSTVSFGISTQFFQLSVIEGYLSFLTLMSFYLVRAGSLSRKKQDGAYDFDDLKDVEVTLITQAPVTVRQSTIVNISNRSKVG